MTPTRHILQIILFISALSAGLQSCFKRELEHEENYINIKQDPSIADNEVLRFRTFKLDDYDRYIIFGNIMRSASTVRHSSHSCSIMMGRIAQRR